MNNNGIEETSVYCSGDIGGSVRISLAGRGSVENIIEAHKYRNNTATVIETNKTNESSPFLLIEDE